MPHNQGDQAGARAAKSSRESGSSLRVPSASGTVTSTHDGSSSSAPLQGLMTETAYRVCPQAEFTPMALEYGTLPLMDVMQNQVTVVLAPLETVAPLLVAGRLKAVAQTGKARQPTLPNVPTFAEAGAPDYNVELWFGMYAPAGTPRTIVARLNREINAVLATPDAKALLANQGLEPVIGAPELLGGLGKAEFARWSAVVTSAGIKAE